MEAQLHTLKASVLYQTYSGAQQSPKERQMCVVAHDAILTLLDCIRNEAIYIHSSASDCGYKRQKEPERAAFPQSGLKCSCIRQPETLCEEEGKICIALAAVRTQLKANRKR